MYFVLLCLLLFPNQAYYRVTASGVVLNVRFVERRLTIPIWEQPPHREGDASEHKNGLLHFDCWISVSALGE